MYYLLLQNVATNKRIWLSVTPTTCPSPCQVLDLPLLILTDITISPTTSRIFCNMRKILVHIIVTQSGKTGLIAYLKVSRNAGFKYLVCCSSPMVKAFCTKFSHVLHQFLTFQSIYCARSQQLNFPPFYIVFKPC